MNKIEKVNEARDYDKYLKIDVAVFKETKESGEETTFNRYSLTRPDASAVLVYNSDEDTVIMVQQHRYPVDVHKGFDANILEIVAGKIDGDEDPRDAAIREVKEEIGYEIKEGKIIMMSKYFPSPGYSSEVIYLFAATVTNKDKTSEGGGVDGEHENITVHNIPANEFFGMVTSGEIIDGKTIMGASAFWHLRNDGFVQLGRQYSEILKLEAAKKLADKVINEEDGKES